MEKDFQVTSLARRNPGFILIIKMEDIIKKEEATAEFNNVFATLERMSNIENDIELALAQWKIREAYACLESYENELCFSFKEGEQEEIDKLKSEINTIIASSPRMGMKSKDATGRPIRIGADEMAQARFKLVQLNKFLRQIKYKRGMGMPKKGEGKMF